VTARAPRNNFTFMMLLGASLVSVRHSAILLGPDASTAGLAGMTPLGVFIMFAVSGFLVGGSWERRPSFPRYLGDRAARIFPGLAVVVLGTVLLLGPLVTALDLRTYFQSPATWKYLLNILLNPQYALPGVFAENPVSAAVNGSLWALPAQFACYLLVPLVGMVRSRTVRGGIWAVMAIATAIASTIPLFGETIFWGSRLSDAFVVMPCFFAAAALRQAKAKLRAWQGWVALALVVAVHVLDPAHAMYADWIVLPVAVVVLGMQATPIVRSAGRFGNPAYGIFLLSFPMQQTLVDGFGTEHAWVSLLCTLLLSFGIGLGLLRAVEQPAMNLVHKFTRRPESAPVPSGAVPAQPPLSRAD
jgi:peptidoglycan/LPS O-acetylase OafA/YrhL